MDLTLDLRKTEGEEGLLLKCFADSDFASEPEENNLPMRSISGMIAYLRNME